MKELTQQQTKKIIDKAIKDYRGQVPTLEAAIGSLLVGQKLGWKVLYLVHDKRTIKKYEDILKVNFRGILPEAGPLAHKSLAYMTVEKLSNFWKAVKGETPIKRRKEVE